MSFSTADTVVDDQTLRSPDSNFGAPVQQLQATTSQALLQGISEVPQTPSQPQIYIPPQKSSLAEMETATLTVLDNIANFGPAKEAIAQKVMLKLQQSAHLDHVNEAGQALATYRKNLSWTLIQPPNSPLRKECWRWIIYIAERFPSIIVTVAQLFVDETSTAVSFLKQEYAAKAKVWTDTIEAEVMPGKSLEEWMSDSREAGRKVIEESNTLLHHCTIMKVLRLIMAGYQGGDEKAKVAIREL